MVISPEYRRAMSSIFSQISQVSAALGWGADTMFLLFRNTRTLVLDASTAFGRSFDLAEISWFKSWSDFLRDTAHKMNDYKRDPGLFLSDLAELIERPYQNAKANIMNTIFSGIDTAAKLINNVAETVKTLNDDLRRLIFDLPESIRKQVEPMIKPVSDQINNFIKFTYEPAMKAYDKAIGQVADDLNLTRSNVSNIIDRLKKPGKLVTEVAALPDDEEARELFDLGGAALRPARAQLDAFAEVIHSEVAKYYEAVTEEEREALRLTPPKPNVTPIGQARGPRLTLPKSWFQGEY